jgi:hypothetical protein
MYYIRLMIASKRVPPMSAIHGEKKHKTTNQSRTRSFSFIWNMIMCRNGAVTAKLKTNVGKYTTVNSGIAAWLTKIRLKTK